MQDFTRGERLFGDAELLLRDAPQPELLADALQWRNIGIVVSVAWMLWQHPTRRASAWQHTLQQLASNLARAGLHPPAGSPAAPSPLTWASLVEATLQAPRQASESERAAAGALAERLRALDASHYGATPQRPARLRPLVQPPAAQDAR